MKYFTKEIKIGVAGIAALFILIYGISYLKGIHLFKPTSYFYVKLSDANELTKSSPVIADGYQVGIVRDIIYDYAKQGNVIAEIDVNPNLRIPKGSTAEVNAEVLGGVKMVLLLANNPREALQKGDTLTGCINNGVMGKMATLMPQIESIVPKLDSILGALNTILSNPAISDGINNLAETSRHLKNITAGLDRMTSHDLPATLKKIDGISSNLLATTGNIREIDFKKEADKLDATLENLQLMSAKLNSKDNTVGLLLNDDLLYRNLNKTMTDAQNLLEDLKENPKRYVHFSLFGKKK